MIRFLALESVRCHLSSTIALDRRTKLEGRNGVGKSTIADLIAFVYQGCDRMGQPLPVSLIAEGADKMKVSVDTGKAVLERTLTRKKNGSLKLTKGDGIPVPLTQEQLNTMLGCDRDAFLSASIAGYFMGLPDEKRLTVLRSFIPPVDRTAVLESLLDSPLDDALKAALALDKKRTDLVRDTVSKMRGSQEKEMANLQGQLTVITATPEPGPKPEVTQEDLTAIMTKKQVWDEFESRLNLWKRAVASFVAYDTTFITWEDEKRRLGEMRALITVPKIPEFKDHTPEINELTMQKLPAPAAPAMHPDTSFERCPTCGQVVGQKHREATAEMNKKLREEHEIEVARVAAHNHEISKKLNWLLAQKERDTEALAMATKEHNKARKEIELLTKRLETHEAARPSPVADPGLQPQPPVFDKVDQAEIATAKKRYDEGVRAISVWQSAALAYESSEKKAASVREGIARIQAQVSYLRKIEDALAVLDDRVFALNEQHYGIREGYRFAMTPKGEVTIETPYGNYAQLSTGQALLADAFVCEKIANSLPRPVKIVFIDNADLVSEAELLNINVEQIIVSYVKMGEDFRVSLF